MPVQTPDSIDVVIGNATKAPDYNVLRDDMEQALRALDFGTAAQIAGITPSVGDAALATDTKSLYVCLTASIWTLVEGGGDVAVGRGYIDGLTLSRPGDTLEIAIAKGAARSDDNTVSMGFGDALVKDLSSVFATGSNNGMRDPNVSWPPSSQWFYLYAIFDDAGVEENDIFATDDRVWAGDTLTLPTDFDKQRYIGAVYYDSAANEILDFFQRGDYFRLKDPIKDLDAGNPGAANVYTLLTLTVPQVEDGVMAHLSIWMDSISGGGNMGGIVRPPGAGDSLQIEASVLQSSVGQYGVSLTDEDGQVEWGIANQVGAHYSTVTITTIGWEDQRGKNAA